MGFLSSLLPTVVGLGVGAATGNPMLGAAISGGLGYARSGSLMQGLMSGLAGYGGANLGQALATQGMQDATIQAGLQQQAAQQAGFNSVQDLAQPIWKPPVDSMAPELVADNAAMAENLGKYTQAYEALNKVPTGLAGLESAGRGLSSLGTAQGWSDLSSNLGGGFNTAKTAVSALSPLLTQAPQAPGSSIDANMGQRYAYSANTATPMPAPDVPEYGNLGQDFGRQQRYFAPSYTKISDEEAKKQYGFAVGGPVEQMSRENAIGTNTGYPQAGISQGAYATPWQTPVSRNVVVGSGDANVDMMTGAERMATGGLSDLGGYSDGGRLLRGPGDGVSDSIPAVIGKKQPARLADGEFVVPARIVSELGNGSTEAGARKLYAMMDRVQKARGKTVGKGRVAKNTRADTYLPA